MTRGRRLRRRRRRAAVAGGICAVAILAGTGTAIASLTAAPSAPSQPGPAQHRPAGDRAAYPGAFNARHSKAGRKPD